MTSSFFSDPKVLLAKETARTLANMAHTRANQTYAGHAYVFHLDEVAALVASMDVGNATSDLLICAYLHDILEDTDIIFETLVNVFGLDVAQIVSNVTDPPKSEDGPFRNRKEVKAEMNRRLSLLDAKTYIGSNSLKLKILDRLANVRSCVRFQDRRLEMYKNEHHDFYRAINRGDRFMTKELGEIERLVNL